MSEKAVLVLANGFEEIEAITPADILKRCGVDLVLAGLGGKEITGAHDITVKTNIVLDEIKDTPDALILPGGMPGAENLASSVVLKDIILKMHSEKKIIAAICASPALVLVPTGILNGKEATCFPGMEKVHGAADVLFKKDAVVTAGNIITSRGAGTAPVFGLAIAEELVGREKAEMIAEQMLYKL